MRGTYLSPEDVDFEEVSGVLWWFCVIMTLIRPFFYVFEFIQLWFLFETVQAPYPHVMGVLVAIDTLVVVLGVVAGALIWMKRKPGIVLAHVALVARIVMILVVLVFLAMLYQAASGWPWYRTLRYYGAPPWAEIAFNIACILYLRTSRRLKATLHLEQPPANAGSAS
jgi:hypothetical protein